MLFFDALLQAAGGFKKAAGKSFKFKYKVCITAHEDKINLTYCSIRCSRICESSQKSGQGWWLGWLIETDRLANRFNEWIYLSLKLLNQLSSTEYIPNIAARIVLIPAKILNCCVSSIHSTFQHSAFAIIRHRIRSLYVRVTHTSCVFTI